MSRAQGLSGTLRGRLVLLVCFATLPALLFTFYAANSERTSVLLRTEKDARLLGDVASREHTNLLEGARDLVARLANLVAQAPGDACPTWLPTLLAGYPRFTTIGLLAPDGELVCSARPAPGHVNMRDNAAFVRALASREAEVGDYTIGPIVGRPVLHVARALRAADGAVRGVLFAGIDLRWLAELAAQTRLPPTYALLIADRTGRVLAQSGAVEGGSHVGDVIPGLSEVAATQGKAVLDVAGEKRRFFVATSLPGISTVTVVVGLPYDRMYGEADRAFYRTAIGLGLLTLFTIACALLAAEATVLRVLRSLTRTARRFGAGDLAARAAVVSGRGELTELTGAFNTMADALASRQRESIETQQKLRALSHGLVVAREAEAGRIARELHDELGQVLTSVKIDLAGLCRKCDLVPTTSPGVSPGANVAELSGRIDDAVDFVRRVSADLRPPVLDRLGLAAALEWQAHELEARSGLAVVLEMVGVDEPIDELVSITLFRIAQEALTNIARHAGATEVVVELRADEAEVILAVRDDGKGMAPGAADDAHSLGVIGMRERALLANGRLEISSSAGQGTAIVVTLPRTPKEPSVAHPAG